MFATRTIVVSLLVGTIITLVAGLFPAIRATRVPPIAAVREGFTLPKVALRAVRAVHRARGDRARGRPARLLDVPGQPRHGPRLLSIAGGVLLLFVGVAMISSRTVRPLAVGTSPIAKWALVVVSVVLYPFALFYWGLKYGLLAKDAPRAKRGVALAATLPLAEILLFLVFSVMFGGAAVALIVLLVVNLVIVGLRWRGHLNVEWPDELPSIRPDKSVDALARENSRRNTGRTAATAAALMIGIALVTFVAVLANGMKASNRGAIEDQVKADYVVTAQDGFTPFVAAAGDELARSPDAEVVSNVRADLGKVGDSSTYVTGIDPRTILQTYTFDWKEGNDNVVRNLRRERGDRRREVRRGQRHLGRRHDHDPDPLGPDARAAGRGPLRAAAVLPAPGRRLDNTQTFDTYFERPRNQFSFVNVSGDPTEATTESLDAAVANFPDAKVQTREAWIDQQDEDFNQFLTMLYVLLALSVIVSIFGMVNTLVLSIFERTRELGMLRAVGMTRRQTRRMVRQESVITALIGAALGLPLGVLLAALVTKALQEFDVRFSIPWGQLVVFAFIAVIVGILAAIMPARRAAKLNVLRALQYE